MAFTNFKFHVFLLYLFTTYVCFTQEFDSGFSLNQAIEYGISNNKKLHIDRIQEHISIAEEQDLKNDKLPDINFHTSFHVLSNINQYENGFGRPSTAYQVPRTKYDFTLSAEIPLFLGGKLVQEEEKAALHSEISRINTQKETRLLKLEIITAYLHILHLEDQVELILEKIQEDSLNIHHVSALKRNQLVTNNEVLRTQLQLSNHQIAFSELTNQIAIVEHEIQTLIAYEEETPFHVNTNGLLTSEHSLFDESNMVENAYYASENLSISKLDLKTRNVDLRLAKGTRLPQITGGGSYGYSYPNFMFFPPTAYLYRFGMIGINVNVPISNFYKSKQKIAMMRHHIDIAKIEVEELEEQIRHEVFKANRMYHEAEEKIQITQIAIEQAVENYRIVKTKYNNQLSLITELIDADNALLEAQSRMISLRINKQLKYYQLQYILGNI